MSLPNVTLGPMPAFLQVYVEKKDGNFYSVYATAADAGRIAVDETLKDSTRHVVLRRMRVEGHDG